MHYPASTATSLFNQAASIFDGWTDADTGTRVLKIMPRNEPWSSKAWFTTYHQHMPFLNGGRHILLLSKKYDEGGDRRVRHHGLLDLTTGEMSNPFPDGMYPVEISDAGGTSLVMHKSGGKQAITLWNIEAGQSLATFTLEGDWRFGGAKLMPDGQRVIVSQIKGRPYNEHVHSQFFVLEAGKEPWLLLDAPGFFCNHMMGNPADPNLFSYDRWPCPMVPTPQVIWVMSFDGSVHEMLKMPDATVKPGNIWGGQRDHYVWTPDGTRIASYFTPMDKVIDPASFNHFEFGWWLSVTDWRTGEDLASPYPENRWGMHFNCTPDSRYAVSAGGPGFDYLYAVDMAKLRNGWNERIICGYPKTDSTGKNSGPFPHPFVLPDGSGVIFAAGWPNEATEGVYLAEWPESFND